MTDEDKALLKSQLKSAVEHAINTVGLKEFKKTSMFISSGNNKLFSYKGKKDENS